MLATLIGSVSGLSPAVLVLIVLGLIFVAFLWEKFPPDTVAVAGVALLLLLGLIDGKDVLGSMANSAPLTIAAMFIISSGLMSTGAIDALGRLFVQMAERHPSKAGFVLLVLVMVLSAFINNTPVVIVLIPVFVKLSRALGQSPSKHLIPLSYATILGGTCTLIGTSTNLLVDGVARKAGLEPLGMFEFTVPGIIMGLTGLLYLTVIGRRLLPNRDTVTSLMGDKPRSTFLTEVLIPQGSPLVGSKPLEVALFRQAGGRIIDVLRGDESLRRTMTNLVLEPGDRVVLKTHAAEVMGLRESSKVDFPGDHRAVEPMAERETVVAEGLVGPSSPLVGRRVGNSRLRRNYGVYIMAVHRAGENLRGNLDDIVLEVGDTLLLDGAAEDMRRLATAEKLINLAEPTEQPFRRAKAPVVIAVVIGIMGLAAVEIMPIDVLAIIGVAIVLLTRSVDPDDAYRSVDWRIIIMIISMLAIGRAMEKTGAVELVVEALVPWLQTSSPWLMLAAVYILASFLTEIISNNAVAVILTPLVISLAHSLGVDPRPFVIAVMFGASASFATPIGYQTNTMVYSAGGYRFIDFVKVGLPLNIICGIVIVAIIPLFWSF